MKRISIITIFICSSILSWAQDKSSGQTSDYLLYGGIAVAGLILAILVYRFFKSTAEKKGDSVPVIKHVNPNPSKGPISIKIEGHASQIKVFNKNGQQLGAFAIIGGSETHLNLSSSPRGSYVVTAYYGSTASNPVEFTLE